MSELHPPLLGLFGTGFVLDVLWRGLCDWLERCRRAPWGVGQCGHTGPCRGLDYESADA
jgi:hypothetical protein